MPQPPPTLFSIVVPARNEVGSVGTTVRHVHEVLAARAVSHEIIVVNDGSTDGTWELLGNLCVEVPTLRIFDNTGPNGFGHAIRHGLEQMKGDAVAIMMADESDSPEDLLRYWDMLLAGHQCVFGSRFVKGGAVIDYPLLKLFLNRAANTVIRILFGIGYNDTTNAFKAYRREVMDACAPLTSADFNLTVELPLKAIVRGYSFAVIPIRWQNRRTGIAKLKIHEMGSRYLRVIWTLWREHRHRIVSKPQLVILFLLALFSLKARGDEPLTTLKITPLPQRPADPQDNRNSPAKTALGRLLFFDPILSATKDIACATCHHPSLGWADGRATPLGVNASGIGPARRRVTADAFPLVKRNAPSVLNVGFNGVGLDGKVDPITAPMFWDSRVASLESQALAPIRAAEEMRGNACAENAAVDEAVKRVGGVATYRELFAEAFGAGDPVNASNLAKAIAAFERSLVTTNAPFDRFARGDAAALTDLQKRGLKAFESAGCALCHNGPMLSDYKLHFIGTPGQKEARDFRTPSLRNLKHTAPYMHNGSVATITDVLAFYDRLMDETSETLDGGDAASQPLDPLLKKLNVNPDDFAAIEDFLEALNDDSYDRSVPESVPSGLPVPK